MANDYDGPYTNLWFNIYFKCLTYIRKKQISHAHWDKSSFSIDRIVVAEGKNAYSDNYNYLTQYVIQKSELTYILHIEKYDFIQAM